MQDRAKKSDYSGFTIVELLIVIVVIAILATISIVAYRGIQERARASQASAGLTQAKKKLELYKVDNGSYPTTGNLSSAGVNNGDVSYQYTSDGTSYCLTGTVGTTSYKTSNTSGPAQGGCAGHGQGGVDAITNLADNPSAEVAGGWASNNSGQYPAVRDTSMKRTGAQGIESHNNSSNTLLMSLYAVGAVSTSGFSIQQNTTYNVSFYFRAGVPSQGRIYCTFRQSDGTYTGATYGSYSQAIADQWTRASGTCASPTGATMMRLGVQIYALSTQPAGTSAYADDAMVTEGATLYNYADGSSTDWAWNGTTGGSTSTGPAL